METTDILNRRYADLCSDSGFKAVFSKPENEKALIKLLNTILAPDREIASLELSDREKGGYTVKNKRSLFDVRCTDKEGNFFIVEMQRRSYTNYFARCFGYGVSSYASEMRIGAKPSEYPTVYVISLLAEKSHDPLIAETDEDQDIINKITPTNKHGKVFEDKTISNIFVRLYLVTEQPDENTSDLERCCWLLKNLSKMGQNKCPEEIHGESFKDLVEAAEIAGLNVDQKLKYEESMLDDIDIAGINQDYYLEGEAKGEANKSREIARAMIAQKLSLETIMTCTGLSKEVILAL